MYHHLILVSEFVSSFPFFKAQLESVFGNSVSISSMSLEEFDEKRLAPGDVVLTTAGSAADFYKIRQTVHHYKQVFSCSLCLRKEPLAQLGHLKNGTRALVVNHNQILSEECIAQLREAGYNHLEYLSYWPGGEFPDDIGAILHFGEPEEAAETLHEVTERTGLPAGPPVLDLGFRQIDAATFVELADALRMNEVLKTRRFSDYLELQFSSSGGIAMFLSQNQRLERYLTELVQLYPNALLCVDDEDVITNCNYKAAAMFATPRLDLIGRSIQTLAEEEALEKCRKQQVPLICSSTHGDLRLVPVLLRRKYLGMFVIGEAYHEPEGKRLASALTGMAAQYDFADGFFNKSGRSVGFSKVVEKAAYMAKKDSPILITGENGSGKDRFAQAIHNASSRAGRAFAAINCSGLETSLLEEQLFGRESGPAAGKRGKATPICTGALERADGGTLFLENVDALPTELQLKLVRALCDRSFRRINGSEDIPVDFRVISASAVDLRQRMEERRFHPELYYRISTLPLEIPPLRMHPEEIFSMAEEYKREQGLIFSLTEEAKKAMLSYPWPGNLWELRNCISYLGCFNLSVVDVEDLPELMQKALIEERLQKLEDVDIQIHILSILRYGSHGRKYISEELKRRGIELGEAQVRRHLKKMSALRLIHSGVGRKGSSITGNGVKFLEKETG